VSTGTGGGRSSAPPQHPHTLLEALAEAAAISG
jgi:hypothetical protein